MPRLSHSGRHRNVSAPPHLRPEVPASLRGPARGGGGDRPAAPAHRPRERRPPLPPTANVSQGSDPIAVDDRLNWVSSSRKPLPRGAGMLDPSSVRLVHVDLATNLWVAHQKFEPGTQLLRHRHTGHVHVFTLAGAWKYLEYDDVNRAGSYLFEPANSIHTFKVLDDTTEPTEIWFMINGSNLNLDDDGNVVSVYDAESISRWYAKKCADAGVEPNVIVS